MSTLRIVDAPLLPNVDGTEKIPTGGRGDYAISVDQIKGHIFQDIGKELVGLGNVDNTSDLDKPVSTAQQAALNLKADKTYVDTNLDLKADKTNVYTRTETSLALSQKADLVNGVIPENQIPSSFNDVLEFTTPNLPIIGESGKIYVTTDTNKTWRWAGNKYVEISGWNPDSVSKIATVPTYYTKEAGVNSVTGVTDGAYFNVRSSSDESYVDEYQNVGGAAVATGKRYLSALGVAQQDKDASTIKDASGKNQQQINDRLITPYNFGAIQESTAPVSEWYTVGSANYKGYANLAAVQVDYPHVVDGTEFIAWAALQKFFDVVNSTNRAIFNMYGNFYIDKELNFNGNGVTVYNKNIRVDCDCTIWDKSLNGLNYLIAFENANNTTFTGVVRGYGAGASTYSSRKTIDIFLVKAGCSYSTFDVFIANYAKRWGLSCLNSSTQLRFNYVKSNYCGTASSIENIPALQVTRTVTNIENTGTANSIQNSILTLSSPLPDTMTAFDGHMYSKTANIAYEITTISADRLQVTVRPWVDPAHVGSDWYCCIGGAVSTSGNDGSVHKFGYIDSFVCNIGYWAKSLYSAEIGTLVTQSNTIGWIAGRSMQDTTVMGYIAQMYCENDAIEVLIPNTCNCTIGTYLGNINKIASYEYIAVGTYSNASKGTLKGLNILNVGAGGKQLLLSAGSSTPTNASTLNPHFDNTMPMMVKYRDAPTITLNESESGAKLTGKVGYKIIAVGSGANNQPTGTWTFNPRSGSGWTVNGLASATISGFTEPTDIVVYADYVNKNWIVKAMGLVPVKSGSVVYDPVSLATGARTAISTIAVTGAALGDKVAMAFSRDLQGVNLEGYVSAVNTVSFYFENRTGATVDLASGTVSAKIV